MAGYDYTDDDYDDLDSPRQGSRFVPILLSLAAILGIAFLSHQLYLVAYGSPPGEFIGSGANQIQLEEGMVNIPVAMIHAKADPKSDVLYQVQAGKRFLLDGREGQFFRVPLPKGGIGYVPMHAITPGFMFIKDDKKRTEWEKRYFPKRFTRVVNSYWEDQGAGRSSLSVEVRNYALVPLDKVWIDIQFQNEDDKVVESIERELEGRIEPGEAVTFPAFVIDLGGNSYPKSQILVVESSVARDEVAPTE